MARALAWLLLAGPTIGFAAIILPHSESTSEAGIAVDIGLAYLTAALVLIGFDRLAPSVFPPLVAWGSILVTAAVYHSGDEASAYAFFYLWVGLYSAYFFSARAALVQAAMIGAAYGTVLAVQQPAGLPVDRWLITMGTLLVTGGLVGALSVRVKRLIVTLSDAARTDALTGLLNRHGFEEAFDIELERARRGGHRISLLVADLDHFKAVNDTLGHDGGDAVLVRVATTLSEHTRLIDTAARVGGEEFAIILPESDERSGYAFAERLRSAVGAAHLDGGAPLSISIGIATYPEDGISAGILSRSADLALYAAKRTGRNRSVLYSVDLSGTLSLVDSAGGPAGPRRATFNGESRT